nr:ulp1 protease family, C-terminal catalytic domain-containing protein [Tanacetum cinerariifolium]
DSKSKTSEVTPEMVKDVVKKLDASKFKPFQNSLVLANNEEPKADKKGDDKKLLSAGISKSKIRTRSLKEFFLRKQGPKGSDVVFEAHGQLIGYKGIMESLRPGSKIHASVVDIWVCFPIVQSGHFYYITFNLIKDEVHVIDNLTVCPNYKELPEKLISKFAGYLTEINHHKAGSIGRIKPDEVHVIDNLTVCPNYKELPEKLISKFAGYLTEINHRKVGSVGRIKHVRLEFTWQTTYNCVDYGVFLMRHMEIYKGMHKLENGLAQEGLVQQEQLNDLRRKYATKILLADINEHKEALKRKVSVYNKLTREEKSINMGWW